MRILLRSKRLVRAGMCAALLLASFASSAVAQSIDVAWPSPVRTNEVRGTIPARDLGDPRVTDHFYAFTGTPGDVLITVDSRNLNGDIDVFTASNLRPLLKFTVYAGPSSPITKSIYLRRQEDLILRVEGRTPDDDDASYSVHFGGAFEPITSGPLAEHEDAIQPALAAGASKGGRRVSSVGARIDQPPSEVAETPKPEPTPVAPVETEPRTTTARSTPRNSRPRRPAVGRTRPTATAKPVETRKPNETAAKDEAGEKSAPQPSDPEATATPARPARRSKSARSTRKEPAAAAESAAAPEPEASGPRLIIETSDGTLVDRLMGGVRRVTVENGQVVVIGKDGKIQRIPLASVVRMTIAP